MRRVAAAVLVLIAAAGLRRLPAQDRTQIAAALAAFVGDPALQGARVGVHVVDPANDAVLATHDADKGFLTASNMKLLSAAVALQTLGPDFRWTTRLLGPAPQGDVVDGDLWLVGSGDPSLGGRPGADAMAPMRALADQLFAAGVRRVRGAVRGDGRVHAMGPYGSGWQWDYLTDDYAAPCAGLNWAENVVALVVGPGAGDGAPANLRVEPADLVRAQCRVRTVAAGQATALTVTPERGDPGALCVAGTIARDQQPQRLLAAVPDAERYAALALQAALAERGIGVAAAPRGGDEPESAAPTLAQWQSPPLREVLAPTLLHSINLYAEQLWRTAAQHAAAARTSADCERHALAVLQRLGVDTAGMVLADGSGLSRRNLVQPRQLVALLAAIRREPQLASILPALPVGGESGTLRPRLCGNATRGHVRAKTGFVSYVCCLSGYLDRPGDAPPLFFAILVNNFTCPTDQAKAAIDAFVQRLAVASGWSE